MSQFEAKMADWTSLLNIPIDRCPIFFIKSPADLFGCDVRDDEYKLSDLVTVTGPSSNGFNDDLEKESPMFSLMLQEAYRRKIPLEPVPMAILKRGICSFAEKAKALVRGSAAVGMIVNMDDNYIDMPRGKENIDNCTSPIGSLRQRDGELLQHEAAAPGETLAVISSYRGHADVCVKTVSMIEEIIDKWSHSIPPMPSKDIFEVVPPGIDSRRKIADEGGRIAVSGQNGWAFFDYHLALFGSQEVPLTPMRLVFANPPHGCDPKAFLNRISGAAVAILRGGGCSFGIKVLNAQSLGAKLVIIVNSEKGKPLQRLMAMKDEEEQIEVPTIMISQRIKLYYERLLKAYYPLDQLLISIQPTGLHGRYEEKIKKYIAS